jgi:hypothetical protein
VNTNDYQMRTQHTAIYPGTGTGNTEALTYTALGLVDEAAELAEALYNGAEQDIFAEAGDVLWYASQLLREMDENLADLAGEDWEKITYSPAVNTELDFMGLFIHTGHIAGRAKKIMRDGHAVIPNDYRASILNALHWTLVCVASTLAQQGKTLGEAAEANAAKLADRAERNVLTGDGDNR